MRSEGRALTGVRRLHVSIVSEALKWPPDEALKLVAHRLTLGMTQLGDVHAVGTRGKRGAPAPSSVTMLRINRTFLSLTLWRTLWRFAPDVLIYLPGSGLTTYSLIRALVLRLIFVARWKRPMIVVVSIQPRRWRQSHAWLLRALDPVLLVVQSPLRRVELEAAGIRTLLLYGGVDPIMFYPVDQQRRALLRRAYGISPDRFVVLHVGHLKPSRNLDVLKRVKEHLPEVDVVLAVSSSTVPDQRVVQELTEAGVRIINRYVPHIEDLYQLADCYLFPVEDSQGCAELPLSVLEALACGLQVVTRRFGALPDVLPAEECVCFYDTLDELLAAIRTHEQSRQSAGSARRARWIALRHSWTHSAVRLANDIRVLLPKG
jgi:glycosyltransferase involved in cell wall biosynthesis